MEVKQRIVNTWMGRRNNECDGQRAMHFVLYEYTFTHSDLVEEWSDFYCKLCKKPFKERKALITHIRFGHELDGVERKEKTGSGKRVWVLEDRELEKFVGAKVPR